MSERKDKKKVIGEPMSDEQIRAFLGGQPESGLNADFHLLQRAYRSLREEDFDRFLDAFAETGGKVDATDPAGRTLADIIANHGQSAGYLAILKRRLQ